MLGWIASNPLCKELAQHMPRITPSRVRVFLLLFYCTFKNARGVSCKLTHPRLDADNPGAVAKYPGTGAEHHRERRGAHVAESCRRHSHEDKKRQTGRGGRFKTKRRGPRAVCVHLEQTRTQHLSVTGTAAFVTAVSVYSPTEYLASGRW